MTMTMKTALQVLLSSILHANYAVDSRSTTSQCVELNFRAASLQSGRTCALINARINDGDIFDGSMDEIDTACGALLENFDRPGCVEEVVDVVSGISHLGCDVTGGEIVSNFIYTVNNDQDGFALLNELACKGQGQCYTEIQKAMDYCQKNPTDENCINYLTCDCLVDLFTLIETLSEYAYQRFIKRDPAIFGKIEAAGTACRCKDIKAKGSPIEPSPSCALPAKIVNEGDFFAANDSELADTCNANVDRTCVEDAVYVVDGSTDYGCTFSYSDNPLFYNLYDFKEDFNAITEFACNNNNDCYSALRRCQMDNSCLDSLSCDCIEDFVSMVGYLSPKSKQDFLKLDPYDLEQMQQGVGKCLCTRLNSAAGSLQQEGYCSLHNSIVKEGYIFAGNSTTIQSTCAEHLACVGNVTSALAQIDITDNCEFKQKTNYIAKFLYNVNNNTDFSAATQFICNNWEPDSSGCYEQVKAAVESCKSSATGDCAKSASSDCLDAFLEIVNSLSDDWKGDFLGTDLSILRIMEPNHLLPNATLSTHEAILLSNETHLNNDTQSEIPSQSDSSSAPFYATPSIVLIASSLALASKLS